MKRAGNDEWAIVSRTTRKSGTYFLLNAQSGQLGRVSVKLRTGAGEPWVCLTCLLNKCQHVRFVQAHDTPGAPDTIATIDHDAATLALF